MAEHEPDGHDAHDGHGGHLAHVASIKVLVGVLGALIFLTVITVLAAKVDFGGRTINLVIALLIASVKVSLVVLFFMHLKYDKIFHSVVMIVALWFAILFIGFAWVDRAEYEDSVQWDEKNPPSMQQPTPPRTPVVIP